MNEINGHDLSKDKVNLETSQIPWKELQRFFFFFLVVYVAKELYLVDVAYQFSRDNKTQVEQWLQSQQVAMVSDEQALAWWDEDAVVWAVVVKPWLLVQL